MSLNGYAQSSAAHCRQNRRDLVSYRGEGNGNLSMEPAPDHTRPTRGQIDGPLLLKARSGLAPAIMAARMLAPTIVSQRSARGRSPAAPGAQMQPGQPLLDEGIARGDIVLRPVHAADEHVYLARPALALIRER